MPASPKKYPALEALNAKQRAFVIAYCGVDNPTAYGNATQSALAAGYSENTAHSQATRLLGYAKVKAAIKEIEEDRFERAQIDGAAILKRAEEIMLADARELTSHHYGSCRYCWGEAHLYQWKTEREFNEAKEESERRKQAPPTCEGGFGYRLTNKPNPNCPECSGLGVGYTRIADTDMLSPDARLLFEGIKETKNGIEVNMASKKDAMMLLARHYGLLKEKVQHEADDALTALIKRVQGNSFPVATEKRDDDA